MALGSLQDNDQNSFTLDPEGKTARRVVISGAPMSIEVEGFATETNQDEQTTELVTINTKLEDVKTKLDSLIGNTDELEGFTDGLEGLIISTNALLTTIRDNADQLEGYTDQLEGYVDQLEGFVDDLETLITSTNTKLDTIITSEQILDDVPTAMNGAFVKGAPSMGQLDDTATTAATEDNLAPVRITAQRAMHINLRNNAGTEIGTTTNPVIQRQQVTTSATLTSVSASTSSVTLLAANSNRGKYIFYNDSNSSCYVAFAATATTTAFTKKMGAREEWISVLPVNTGVISGIWDVASGAMRITEMTW